jgi:hypothetical protein
MAPILFAHTSVGTPVTITGNGPDYKTYLAQSASKAKANAAKYASAKKKLDDAAAAATAATSLAPDDPNGPAPTPAPSATPAGTPATTPAAPSPAPAPATPVEEVKPAAPATPAPTPGTVQ